MRHKLPARMRPGLLLPLAVSAAGCVTAYDPDYQDCLRVGVLLPYTGALSSAASNNERAVTLAAEALNAAGGVGGQQLCLVPADTHSELRRGMDAARWLLAEQAVAVLIGPHEDALALQVVPLARAHQVLVLTGGPTSPNLYTAPDDGLLFRTLPSALVLGPQLLQRMYADGRRRIAVLYEASELGAGWGGVLGAEAPRVGLSVSGIHSFLPGQATYRAELQLAFGGGADAVVLVANAGSGAALVQEWSAAGLGGRWYFTPPLRDQVFVDNLPPGAVDGMLGVASALGGEAEAFAVAFGQRWGGDRPLAGAYYYFDALVLWALAYEAAAAAGGGAPSAAQVAAQVTLVANGPGQLARWDDLDAALGLARQGVELDYLGASGQLELDGQGDRQGGAAAFWTTRAGQLVDLP